MHISIGKKIFWTFLPFGWLWASLICNWKSKQYIHIAIMEDVTHFLNFAWRFCSTLMIVRLDWMWIWFSTSLIDGILYHISYFRQVWLYLLSIPPERHTIPPCLIWLYGSWNRWKIQTKVWTLESDTFNHKLSSFQMKLVQSSPAMVGFSQINIKLSASLEQLR